MKKILCILFVVVMLTLLTIPAFAAEADAGAVIVPAQDAVLDFFPALFEGIISIFEAKPMSYLFGILILSFVILIFRTIFHF